MKAALRGSLRLRLIIGSAIAVVVAVLLAGLFIGNLYRLHSTQRFQEELDHHLDELIAMTSLDAEGVPHVAQPLSDPLFNVPGSGLYWQVDGGQKRPAQSISLAGHRLVPLARSDWRSGRIGEERLLQRSVRFTLDGREQVATIASARALLEKQVHGFWRDLVVSMSAIGLLLLTGAVMLICFGLLPVQRLGEEVDRLRHGEVTRLDPRVPLEFAAVVDQLNALLSSQTQLITRARTQAGNLAHDLRTPLALIIDEAEQIRDRGDVKSADFLLERCAVMQRQIDHHLTRAAAAGTRSAGTLTELAPVLEQIIAAMQRLHSNRDLHIETDVPDGLRLPCDRGDLAEILSNLIDNACKWARKHIVVHGGENFIEIRDDGPGIPRDQRGAVLTVGKRLDPHTPGTGLGLSATSDLLDFYGGNLILKSNGGTGLAARAIFAS